MQSIDWHFFHFSGATSEPVSLSAFRLPGAVTEEDKVEADKEKKSTTEAPQPPTDASASTATPATRRKRVTELPLPTLAARVRVVDDEVLTFDPWFQLLVIFKQTNQLYIIRFHVLVVGL